MAFFSDFDVPWWVQGSRYPQFGPHAYQQDPHHLRQQYPSDFHPSRTSTQLWPETYPHPVPTYYDTYPGRHSRLSYPRNPYEQCVHDDEPGLLGPGSTFSRRHYDRRRPVSHSQTGQAQLGRSDQHPDTFNMPARSHSPYAVPGELHLEDLLGLRPTSRAPNKPQGASCRAGSPTVWSVHSPAQHDSDDDEAYDEDAQLLELERDRLQQLKKRQQLQNLQLRQQLLQEQQQQALQEQRRREALLERELQAQRELQRRRAAEHQLHQQQQEALLAALQQQRRRQQQKLQEQERRLAQQRQAEYQAELERRLQQTLEQLQQQHQIEAVRRPEVAEPEEVQFGGAPPLRHALERQQAQRAQQRAQESQQTAQQVQAEKMAQRAQQAQHGELERQQQRQQAAQQQELHKQAQHAQQAQQAQQRSQQLPEAKLKAPMHAMRRPLTPDEAASCIQSHYKGYRMRSEKPMLTALGKANHQLAQVFSRLYQVESCITALQAQAQPQAQKGAAVKLKHHHGKCGSPEQLQKQLVELSELSMQVVLSMDELHSDRSEVRMVRKQVVKKALALMERIDNVRAGMLRSLLDASHPHDQAASKTPPQTPKRDQAQSTTPDAVQQTPTNQLHSAQESFMAAEAAAADTLTDGSLKAAQGLVADALTDNSTQQQGTSAPESDAAGAASNKYSNAQPEQMDSFKTGSGAKKAISGDVAESDTDGAAGNAASLAADTDADTDVFASLSDKEVIDGICSGVDAVMAGQTAVREGEDGSVQDLVGGAEEDV